MFLGHSQKVFSQLHIADQDLFNYADACDQPVLAIPSAELTSSKTRHRHAKLTSDLVLHRVEL